jgi:hypothetical protein
MIVAWHEVPGKLAERIRPVGYGMISVLNRIRSSRPIRYRTPRARYSLLAGQRAILWTIASHHTVPYGTGSGVDFTQALRARLLSFSPSGTKAGRSHKKPGRTESSGQNW